MKAVGSRKWEDYALIFIIFFIEIDYYFALCRKPPFIKWFFKSI